MMNFTPEVFRECSSFYTNNESDPWEMHFPVISSINGDTFSAITSILKNCITYPSQNTGMIIYGEAGFGKTHMIGRIRKYSENPDNSVFFSTIRPIIDEQSPMRHLVRGIMTSLAHDTGGSPGYSQVHRLLSEIIIDYYRDRLKGKSLELKRLNRIQKKKDFFFKVYKEKTTRAEILSDTVCTWISERNCSINPDFIRLLFSLCNPDLHALAFQRITGYIADKEDADKLGIHYRENLSDNALEEEARDFVISLGHILAGYGYVLVVCFDQLENLRTKEQIYAFGLMILTLVNESNAMLPLAMSRTLHWDDVIQPNLERSVVERLTGNSFTLFGCSGEEVQEILKSRIRSCMDEGWEEPYSWLLVRMRERLTPNPSPREVISLANQIMRQNDTVVGIKSPEIPAYLTPDDVISTAYQNEREKILSDMDLWPPDYEELTEAVILYLTSRNIHFTHERLARKSILSISEVRKGCCIIINTNPDHTSVGAGFTHGTEYLLLNPGSSCLYLTDPRCIITKPQWKQANEKRDAYITAGGKIYQPSDRDIARFYALYSVKCKVTEGDLLIGTGSGMRSVTNDELISFVGNTDLFSLPLPPPS